MANPQKENGHTEIANEILEHLISAGLNGTELAVALKIIRNTYGWQKKEDEISISQFMASVPASKQTICTALERLQLVKIIRLVKKGNSKNQSNLWSFNKNYDEWQLVKKYRLVKVSTTTSQDFQLSQAQQLVKKTRHTKESITKEILQKKERQITPSQKTKKLFNSVEEQDDNYILLASTIARKYKIPSETVRQELHKFALYWTEKNKSGTKERWELEKTFEVDKRLMTWLSRINKFNQRERVGKSYD